MQCLFKPAPRVPKVSKVERAEGTEGDSERAERETASAQRVVLMRADYGFMCMDIGTEMMP